MFERLTWSAPFRAAAQLRYLACFLWLASAVEARPAPASSADWLADGWQTESGLPHNSVTAVLQTSDGYLWVGTLNGLARFDGVRFTVFRSADTGGLRSNRILCLHQDAYGTLWIGTDGGGLSSYYAGSFSALGPEEGLSSGTILALGEDEAGRLWIGTDSGLNLYEAGRVATFFKTDGLPDDQVTALCQPVGQPLLIATGHGLCQFRREALSSVASALPPGAQTNITCLLEDTRRQLWIGGEAGLFRSPGLGTNRGKESWQVHPGSVLTLLERKERETWFGTRNGELCRIRPGDEAAAAIVWHSQHAITALCEDREGNVWAGTGGDGLHRLKPRQLRLVPWPSALASQGTRCLFQSPAGELKLVGEDNRLYGWQGDQFVLQSRLALPDGVRIQTACQTRDGTIWIGTSADGLFECGAGGPRQFSERAGISDSAIEALAGDQAGGLWIGTRNGGLNYFQNQAIVRYNTPWGFLGPAAWALEWDRQGDLWIGTSGDGLFRLRGTQFTSYATAAGLPSDQVRALHTDGSDALWVGTDKGLSQVRNGRLTTFTSAQGLPDEPIFQLASDADGNVWVGAANRIYRLNQEQFEGVAQGQNKSLTVVTYGAEDGLPGLQCLPRTPLHRRASAGGDLYFATVRGLVVVRRGGQPWNLAAPPVVLEAVYVNNASVPLTDHIRIAPGKDSLRFEYTALSLTAPGKVRFRYRLEGFDTDWSEPVPEREVRYAKIPAGQYRFQVIACNNDGIWNNTGAGVSITLGAFWWDTLWFRSAAALVTAATLLGFYQLRRVRQREIERLRVRIAGDLHDDIGSSLWGITLLSRTLTKHGNLGAEERQDLEEIHRIATQTSHAIRDTIWLINPAFDTLQDLVARTQDFAGTLLRGVEYRISCDGAIRSQKLAFDFRHNLFLFFKEALTNISRHAQATVVEVRIEPTGKTWRLTLRDNGRGFDPAAVTGGHGLRNLRSRAARMKALFEVQSSPGAGTCLTLSSLRPG